VCVSVRACVCDYVQSSVCVMKASMVGCKRAALKRDQMQPFCCVCVCVQSSVCACSAWKASMVGRDRAASGDFTQPFLCGNSCNAFALPVLLALWHKQRGIHRMRCMFPVRASRGDRVWRVELVLWAIVGAILGLKELCCCQQDCACCIPDSPMRPFRNGAARATCCHSYSSST